MSDQDRSGPNGIRIDVAMLGARLHYGVPRALDHAGLLGTLYTDVYIGNKPWLRWLLQRLPQRVTPVPLQRLQGRDADLSSGKVVSLDALGLRALLARRRVRTHRESREWLAHLGKDFCDAVVQSGLNSASAIYAFSGGAREIFEAAKRHGMLCFLEQTIAPHSIEQRLTQEEREKWPGWEPSLSFEAQGNALAEREQAEWALADYIFCGSVFVAASLRSAMGDGPNCCVVPYGVDREVFRPTNLKPRKDKLNVLFMGAVGLRKGVPYLLEALRRLNSTTIHCRLVGRVDLEPGHLGQYQQWAEIVGPVPRSETVRMYRWADVFVLPSICEGSATVTYEALACGLPVITTFNAGSVVRDGEDGFIIPIRDADAIADRLERLRMDGGLLAVMSDKALERGREFDLASYGDRLVHRLAEIAAPRLTGSLVRRD